MTSISKKTIHSFETVTFVISKVIHSFKTVTLDHYVSALAQSIVRQILQLNEIHRNPSSSHPTVVVLECNGGRRAATGDDLINDDDRRSHSRQGLPSLSLCRDARVCRATTWRHDSMCAPLSAFLASTCPGFPMISSSNTRFSCAILGRHMFEEQRSDAG